LIFDLMMQCAIVLGPITSDLCALKIAVICDFTSPFHIAAAHQLLVSAAADPADPSRYLPVG
jgi:hypothetical protein